MHVKSLHLAGWSGSCCWRVCSFSMPSGAWGQVSAGEIVERDRPQ
jgi:hypothetical protein